MGLGGGAVAKERLTANPTPLRSLLGRERHPEASSSALCRGPIFQRVGRVRWHPERDISLMHRHSRTCCARGTMGPRDKPEDDKGGGVDPSQPPNPGANVSPRTTE